MHGKLREGWDWEKERATHRAGWQEAGIEYGRCLCGCGQATALARQTNTGRAGMIAGEPLRFRPGHGGRLRNRDEPDYVVDPESGCWLWSKGITLGGYGTIRTYDKPRIAAHRWYWQERHGPIPEGLQIDHLCRNRRCVNPDHMELVTSAENSRRGNATKITMAIAEQIRRDPRPPLVVAAAHDLDASTIHNIRAGRRWVC